MQFRTRFQPYESSGITFSRPSRTQQHFRDDCNINNIIARFTRTGVLPQIEADFQFRDVADAPDYRQAMNLIASTNEQFAQLPSDIRKYFDNNPANLLDFLSNPDNVDKAVELGLIERPTPATPPADAGDRTVPLLDVTVRTDTNEASGMPDSTT